MARAMITCMNCHEGVPEIAGRIFAEVFVCPRCFTLAEATYNRGAAELKATLTFLKEVIRERLIKGELQLAEKPPEEMSHTEVLRMVTRLQELYDVAKLASPAKK